ncbi:MAG: hypothetical protein AB7E60_11370 [Sphingobium sp.]
MKTGGRALLPGCPFSWADAGIAITREASTMGVAMRVEGKRPIAA